MIRRLAIGIFALAALVLLAARMPGDARRTTALGSFGRGPTVVLVHGLGSRAEHWLPMARDLARDHRVVLVELPGHGLAEMPGHLTLEDAAETLDRAIAAECDGPVLLVGHSVGGLVAAAEALRAPGRVRALVLVETLRENYVGFGRDSLQGEALFEQAERVPAAAMKAWIRLAVTTDLSPAMRGVRVPVLAVVSARTWPAGESWAACADTLGYPVTPSVTPARITDAGHFVMLDRPARLAELLRRFERLSRADAVAAALR